MTRITFPRTLPDLTRPDTLVVLAPEAAYAGGWHRRVLTRALAQRVEAMVKGVSGGACGTRVEAVTPDRPKRIVAGVLPSSYSRHNAPSQVEAVWSVMRGMKLAGRVHVIARVDEAEQIQGTLGGIARCFPLYDRKTGGKSGPPSLAFHACDGKGKVVAVPPRAKLVVDMGREAARLVDMPTEELTTAQFVKEARKLIRAIPNVKTRVIVGEDLAKQGLGGIYGVGKAAVVAPRLLIMDYRPPKAKRTVALVGKGVVYDTGGLHIKGRGSMESMKADMGGAAAVTGAFRVLAEGRAKCRVIAFCPLAENSVDAHSYRPDDILTMHSGHTVEINNTDAEGRLLLGDGVSYAARKYKPDVIINAATLTGAQLIATGKAHAGVVSNREGLETLAVGVGRSVGEMCFPMPFCPELYQAEFASQVADMKNSVKNRMNAQASCAAQFVYSHIDDLDVPWLHVDLAGPAWRHDRGTGFGVGLLTGIADAVRDAHLSA